MLYSFNFNLILSPYTTQVTKTRKTLYLSNTLTRGGKTGVYESFVKLVRLKYPVPTFGLVESMKIMN